MIGLLRITVAAALLICLANGTFAADAGAYRSAPAHGWANATHRSVSRVPARAMPPIRKPPGVTVLNRQFLDDIDATTLRDACGMRPA